eukprot:GDKJ01023785.1.p1 GENE.GDKJ01023785.1~~GDKJ01023785.1.p1  ORF type:complete len:307 (+),score=13.24 GDKJ01023785.1:1-921(+)
MDKHLVDAQTFLDRFPNRPLWAYSTSLVETTEVGGPAISLAIVNSNQCGAEKRTTSDSGVTTVLGQHVDEGSTPMVLAALAGRPDVVLALIAMGADVLAQSSIIMTTTLHIASSLNDVKSVKALLQGGADVTAEESEKWTALHYATANGHVRVVDLLLASGANANAVDVYGVSPSHLAARRQNQPELLEKLISCGASVDIADRYGMTPLHNAASSGREDTVLSLLANGANVHVVDIDGNTALHLAARMGQVDSAQELLVGGARSDGANIHGYTPQQLFELQGTRRCDEIDIDRMRENFEASFGQIT